MRLATLAGGLLLLVFIGCGKTVPEVSKPAPPIHPDEGLKHLAWQDARSAVGETAFICGKIIDVGRARRVSFLNFDEQRPAEFTGIVFYDNLAKFGKPLEEIYKGKIVKIRGRVSLYKDKPQIIVDDPEQIEILDEMPKVAAVAETAEVPLAAAGKLTVATYNILNLFDAEDDPYHGDEGTPAKPREQLERLAQSIKALNADVIAVQEVENRFYLKRFVEVFLSDSGYEHVVHYEGNDGRGIDVGLISRVPIGPVRSHRHVTFPGHDNSTRKFNRDVLVVTVEPPGGDPLDVWVVHLKSNSGGREFAEPVRLAEANKLRELLDNELADDPQARFMVVGDFNDTWDSATLKTIVGEGDAALWSACSELGDDLPDTYNSGEFQSMIDFILCSPALAETYVKDSFRVVPGSVKESGSDHNPVVSEFSLVP